MWSSSATRVTRRPRLPARPHRLRKVCFEEADIASPVAHELSRAAAHPQPSRWSKASYGEGFVIRGV